MSALSSTSSSFGTAAASTRYDQHANGIDESIKAQALAEEEAAMNQYKVIFTPFERNSLSFSTFDLFFFVLVQTKVASPTAGAAAVNNPFLSSPTNSGNIVDLFGGASATQSSTKASDDLLQLGNPFADMFGPGPTAAAPAPTQPIAGNNMWMNNGKLSINRSHFVRVIDIDAKLCQGFNGVNAAGAPGSNSFVSDSNFTSVFGASDPAGKS